VTDPVGVPGARQRGGVGGVVYLPFALDGRDQVGSASRGLGIATPTMYAKRQAPCRRAGSPVRAAEGNAGGAQDALGANDRPSRRDGVPTQGPGIAWARNQSWMGPAPRFSVNGR